MSFTREDIENWRGDVLYHGTSVEWVDHSVRRYARVQTRDFEGEPISSRNLSVTFDLEESIAYAVRSAQVYSTHGCVLTFQLDGAVLHRLDHKAWNDDDAPLPYLLRDEFTVLPLDNLPQGLEEIFYKSQDDLEGQDVEDVAERLERYCTRQIQELRVRIKELHPQEDFFGEADGERVMRYLEDNNVLYEGFCNDFLG